MEGGEVRGKEQRMQSIQKRGLSTESVREEQGELLRFKNQEVKMKMHCREDGACTKTTSSVGECDHRVQRNNRV